MMNIVLIGYRATGKTEVGKALAKQLGYDFIDSDILIEEEAGCSIADIVKKEGWPGFRNREKVVIKRLAKMKKVVIAAGGGAILDPENVKYLKKSGILIWLKTRPETILRRLKENNKTNSQRPSLTGKSLDAELIQILEERAPLYKGAAHIEIDTNNRSIEEIVKEICKSVSQLGSEIGK
jgi:shikimate kinase